MIKVGQAVPNFTLLGYKSGEFRDYVLSDILNQEKWVVLFFYPKDFTFVCPTEVKAFSDFYEDFKQANSEVLGVSVDSEFVHKAWVEKELGELNYPLLSDIKKEVSSDYDVLIEEEGVALRGTFIIDPKGILKHLTVSDNNVGRSIKETLRVLKALQTGGLCAVEWKEGDKML